PSLSVRDVCVGALPSSSVRQTSTSGIGFLPNFTSPWTCTVGCVWATDAPGAVPPGPAGPGGAGPACPAGLAPARPGPVAPAAAGAAVLMMDAVWVALLSAPAAPGRKVACSLCVPAASIVPFAGS